MLIEKDYAFMKDLYDPEQKSQMDDPLRTCTLRKHVLTGRKVVHKTFDPEQDRVFDYSVLKSLDHPELQKLLLHGVNRDIGFHVLTHFSGISFGEFFRRDMSYETAQKHLVDLFDPLIYLHDNDLVHGDLKPWEFIYNGSRANLIDIETVRPEGILGDDVFGTKGYEAPEQVPEGLITTKSDVFSLGMVIKVLMLAQRGVQFHPLYFHQDFFLEECRTYIPPKVLNVLDRATQYEPSKRFVDALEMKDALEDAFNL